jgi:mRNA interferase RelE/StbE
MKWNVVLAWRIEVTATAEKQLLKIGGTGAKRITTFLRVRIGSLEDPRQTGKALKGAELGSLWRYRVGDYRLICELQDHRLVVLVVEIGHRREIYR